MSGEQRHRLARNSLRWRRAGRVFLWAAGVAWIACAVAAAASCGGTTGHEGLTSPPAPPVSDATFETGVDGETTSDANDAGTTVFDTALQYVDQTLPEAQAMAEGAAGGGGDAAGNQWPACPPNIPAAVTTVDDAGNSTLVPGSPGPLYRALAEGGIVTPVYDAGTATNWQIPAIFTSTGEAPAPAGSPCATQVYLGSAACDTCAKADQIGVLYSPFATNSSSAQLPALPPCSDLLDAGVAAAGPAAGQSLHDLCMNLFNCVIRTGCMAGAADFSKCLCSLPKTSDCIPEAGPGPCIAEVKAAMQIPSDTPAMQQFIQISSHINDDQTLIYHPAGEIESLFVPLSTDCSQSCPVLGAGDGGVKVGDGG